MIYREYESIERDDKIEYRISISTDRFEVYRQLKEQCEKLIINIEEGDDFDR